MKCPRCSVPLQRLRYANSNVRSCLTCNGHLVEKDDVSKIKKRVDKDLESLKSEKKAGNFGDLVEPIRCPRCRCKMDRGFVKKISFYIDECRNCDTVWFDGGELAKIQMEYESRAQTKELNGMRNRIQTMSAAERESYEKRIAELSDHGSPFEQAFGEATSELAAEFWWRML